MKPLCFCLLFGALGFGAAAQSPDLVIDQDRLRASIEFQTKTFSETDCANVEGCASAGARLLVKFDVGLVNIGDGDLLLGEPQANPDLFVWSPCHGHYHLKGVADYQIIASDGTTLLTARKQAFCLRDDISAVSGSGPAKFNCDFQGITAGWEDVYDKSLDCQWLDITGIPDGDYILRVVCNPEKIFVESNYDNNAATVSITLATTNSPPPPPPPPPSTNCTCKCEKKCDSNKPWDWKKLCDKFKGQWKNKPGKCGCDAKCGCKGKCACKEKCHCKGKGQGDDNDDDHDSKGKSDDDDHDGKGKGGDDDHHDGKGNGNADCDKNKGNGGKDHSGKGGGAGGKGKGHGAKGKRHPGGGEDHSGKGQGDDHDDD